MQPRSSYPSIGYVLILLTSYLLSGCGANDTAENEWVITPPETQTPDTTKSLVTESELVIFAGLQSQDAERKTLLTAIDLDGNTLWTAPDQLNKGHQALTEQNADIIVAGGTATAIEYREDYSAPYVEKYDQLGNLLWANVIGDFEYDGLLVDSDATGNIYVLTYDWVRREDSTANDMYFSLTRLTEAGEVVSQAFFSTEYQYRAPRFAVDSQGNSYIALMNSEPDVYKYNQQGEFQWHREIETDDGAISRFAAFAVDQFDRAILFTPIYTEVFPDFIHPQNSLAIAFESNGEVAWEYNLPNPTTDYKLDLMPEGMTFDKDGNIYLTHNSNRQDFSLPCWFCEIRSYKLYMTKLNPDGQEIWQNVLKTDGDGGTNISVNDNFLLVSDNDTFRTFNTSDGSLAVLQYVDPIEIPRELTQAYIASDDSMYFITDADGSHPDYYSLEKWNRVKKQQ